MNRTDDFFTIVKVLHSVNKTHSKHTTYTPTKLQLHANKSTKTIKELYKQIYQFEQVSKYKGLFNSVNHNVIHYKTQIQDIMVLLDNQMCEFHEELLRQFGDRETHAKQHWNTVLTILFEHTHTIKIRYTSSLQTHTISVTYQIQTLQRLQQKVWQPPTVSMTTPLMKTVLRNRYTNTTRDSKSIQNLETDIVRIQPMFIKLAKLVAEQEETILQNDDDCSSIQTNVEKGAEYISDVNERGKHRHYQMIRFMFCIAVCLCLYIII